jgi:murein DD-endopeptidase
MMKNLSLAAFAVAVVLFAMFSSAHVPAQERGEKGIEGTWEGALAGQLHLVVTLTPAGEGAYTGELNSVDQHAILPIENGTLKGDRVRFEVKRVGGVYEGYLIKESEMRGTWTQTAAPAPQPLNFKRTSKPSDTQAPAASTPTPAAHTPKPLTAPLDVVVPFPPTTFQANGKWHLAYELHIANFGRWDCSLTRLEVVSADAAHKPLANFADAGVVSIIAHPGLDAPANATIVPGGFVVAYLWLDFDRREDIPPALVARISMKIGDYPEGLRIDAPQVAVDRDPVAVIAPPLRGDAWVAANGPSNSSHHRRAGLTIDGRYYIAQRFAIDWVELYPDGKTFRGDAGDNKNYRAYGAEIHSVADGIVTEIKDGIPQNAPGADSRAVPMTLETLGGNHVVVNIGSGRFAFYAHMQPGSLRVKLGDKVRAGDVLGLVGNSGNSTEPHLHFHICNANSPLACEGLPYAFASFETEAWDDKPAPHRTSAAPSPHRMEIPLEDDVVRFSP